MKRRITILGLLLITKNLFAALPPAAESLRRLKAIIESEEVYEQLNSTDWVKAIMQTENGYLLETQKCKLYVNVNSIDKQSSYPRLLGPLPLRIDIQKKECW